MSDSGKKNAHTEEVPQPSFPDRTMCDDSHRFPKPSLSYIGLIAKVLLSSPSQRLNLRSIYRLMEERFPYLSGRGQGAWRNSVRHNLSVNECFVKVGHCEDGRGHYWGIHPCHLGDFQRGNFRQCRRRRARIWRERQYTEREVYGCAAWMQPKCLFSIFCLNGPVTLGPVKTQRPEPWACQNKSVNWIEACSQPWRLNRECWEDCPGCWRSDCPPQRFPDSHDRAIVGRWHPSLHNWHMYDPQRLRPVKDSHDSLFFTPLQQTYLPGSGSVTQTFKDTLKPSLYNVNYLFQP